MALRLVFIIFVFVLHANAKDFMHKVTGNLVQRFTGRADTAFPIKHQGLNKWTLADTVHVGALPKTGDVANVHDILTAQQKLAKAKMNRRALLGAMAMTLSTRGPAQSSESQDGVVMKKGGDYEAKDPVTTVLGKLLPGRQQVEEDPLFDVDWAAPKVRGLSTEEMAARLESGLKEREWFVTGRALPELFSDSFYFSDPQVKLTGIREYCRGVRRLFDQQSSRAEIICVKATSSDTIKVVWRNSGKVNLGPGFELKPYVVTTTLQTSAEEDGLIVKQEDKFDQPPLELFAYAYIPSLRSQMSQTPPAEQLRKLYGPACKQSS